MQELATSSRDEVIKLKKAGLTDAEIGRRLGITRERVRQIVKGKLKPKKDTPDFEALLTPREVARLLNIHVNTVRRWSDQGILRPYRISPRGDRRFKRQDVEDFLYHALDLNFIQTTPARRKIP
ncbi:hypothetical protein ES703_27360 [subsurface metagenome]